MAELAPAESAPNDMALFEEATRYLRQYALEEGKPKVIVHDVDRTRFVDPQDGEAPDAMVGLSAFTDPETQEPYFVDVVAYTDKGQVDTSKEAELYWGDEKTIPDDPMKALAGDQERHRVEFLPNYVVNHDLSHIDTTGNTALQSRRQLTDHELDALTGRLLTMRRPH